MQTILEIKQNENGSHNNQTIYNATIKVPEGWCLVPESMMPLENYPFGNLTHKTVTNPGSPYGDQYEELEFWEPIPIPEPPAPPEPTPAEKRRQAYETEPIINWPENSTEMLTVDQANQLWLDYSAEGNEEVAGKLQDFIAIAKASIREKYPDET